MKLSSRALNVVLAAALTAATFGLATDAVPDGPDDPQVNQELYSDVIDGESEFTSIEQTDNTTTDPKFIVDRDEVCTADSGAVIRFSSRWGYPQVHSNSSHVAVGVTRAYVNDEGEMVIKNAGGPIVSMVASPDETLIASDVQVGLSGGSGTTVAKFYSGQSGRVLDLNRGTDWKQVYGTWSNLWLGFTHIVDC